MSIYFLCTSSPFQEGTTDDRAADYAQCAGTPDDLSMARKADPPSGTVAAKPVHFGKITDKRKGHVNFTENFYFPNDLIFIMMILLAEFCSVSVPALRLHA
jgi:hypothetical protein